MAAIATLRPTTRLMCLEDLELKDRARCCLCLFCHCSASATPPLPLGPSRSGDSIPDLSTLTQRQRHCWGHSHRESGAQRRARCLRRCYNCNACDPLTLTNTSVVGGVSSVFARLARQTVGWYGKYCPHILGKAILNRSYPHRQMDLRGMWDETRVLAVADYESLPLPGSPRAELSISSRSPRDIGDIQ